MIDCAHYRRSILTDPHDPSAELEAHLKVCADCAQYSAQLKGFESRLARALRIDTPQREVTKLASGAHRTRRRHRAWFAAAASVLLALGVAGGLWLAGARASLAAAVVAHMAGEPDAWARTDAAVPAPALAGVLRGAHMELRPEAGTVTYAQSCEFRGHRVPHLVVQSAMGPVTVMVLVHETVAKPLRFDEAGYHGVIVPVPGHGSLAVLMRGAGADSAAIARIAERVERATVWTG